MDRFHDRDEGDQEGDSTRFVIFGEDEFAEGNAVIDLSEAIRVTQMTVAQIEGMETPKGRKCYAVEFLGADLHGVPKAQLIVFDTSTLAQAVAELTGVAQRAGDRDFPGLLRSWMDAQ